jgi:signal transduction histidine kinase/ActR/RegA family two-component response regulator
MRKHFEVLAFPAGENRVGVTFTDITERKRAEEERAQAQEELAQLQKMEAVGQLAGGIAHDFNNQMAGVLGYAEMLRERLSEDPRMGRFINNIIVGIRRASDLTAQLLAFARKGKYLVVPVNMHNVILEVVSLLEHSVDKRITIRQQFNARPPVAMGDPTQLQNVILNMALNARDAMPEGGELTFATDVVDLDEEFCKRHPHEVVPGRFVRIGVTDTGTGMDRETMKRVFEPFFTTKPRGKGTGMGLAAAYGTVKNHHGAITLYSEVGRGSTFNVYLPIGEKEAAGEGSGEQEVKRIPGNPHVLVVDDEALVAEMAVDMLSELGCQVTHCDNGREAVDYYRKAWKGIDLVILDMVMPEMNGREAYGHMKQINPKVRALLSSGYSLNGEAQKMLTEGVLSFVQKPYHRAELAKAIVRILEHAKSAGEEPGGDVFKRNA